MRAGEIWALGRIKNIWLLEAELHMVSSSDLISPTRSGQLFFKMVQGLIDMGACNTVRVESGVNFYYATSLAFQSSFSVCV